MDVSILAESRATKPVKLQIPERELCARYEAVFTAAVNDVLRELGHVRQTLPNNIMPLREDMKVAGVAFTVKGAPSLALEDEMARRARMLECIGEGDVVVWDTSGDTESAQWGEVMTMASKKRGCRGAVVDGGVRDTDRVLKQDFPVFCKYRSSNGMLGRFRLISYQTPVMIGGVIIMPGDIVFGDIDGVIAIPRALACQVLIRAEEIKIKEKGIIGMVNDGLSPTQVTQGGGYF